MYAVKFFDGYYRIYDYTRNQYLTDKYMSMADAHEAIMDILRDMH